MRIGTQFFVDVDRIKRDVRFSFYHSSIKTSVVTEGFVILGEETVRDVKVVRALLGGAIRNDKPLFMLSPDALCLSVVNDVRAMACNLSVVVSLGEEFRLVPSDHALSGEDAGRFAYLAVVSEDYLLRRFLSREVLLNLDPFDQVQTVPRQVVCCVGLPPTRELLEESTIAAIRESEHVVLFDRTKANILPHLRMDGAASVVPYDYFDYGTNIEQVDAKLSDLHRRGVCKVTLLVEGHPEIYDLIECLPHRSREFHVRPIKPLLLFAVDILEAEFYVDILSPGFVLTSGYNVRHGIRTSELTAEIECYLGTGISVCIMEMFLGDLPLLLRLLESGAAAKCVFVLTNMFSQEQNIYFIADNRLAEISWVEEIKGKFTSLIVMDAGRVNDAAREAIRSRLRHHAKL